MAYFCLTAWAISLAIVSSRSASSGLSITRQLMEDGRLMVDVYVFMHFLEYRDYIDEKSIKT